MTRPGGNASRSLPKDFVLASLEKRRVSRERGIRFERKSRSRIDTGVDRKPRDRFVRSKTGRAPEPLVTRTKSSVPKNIVRVIGFWHGETSRVVSIQKPSPLSEEHWAGNHLWHRKISKVSELICSLEDHPHRRTVLGTRTKSSLRKNIRTRNRLLAPKNIESRPVQVSTVPAERTLRA